MLHSWSLTTLQTVQINIQILSSVTLNMILARAISKKKEEEWQEYTQFYALCLVYCRHPMLMEQPYQSSAKIIINIIYKVNIDQIKTQVKRRNIYDVQNYRL